VRADLPVSDQAVQSLHAAVEYSIKYPDLAKQWHADSQTVVLLTVKDEKYLHLHGERLENLGVSVAWFREPDLDDSLTAIACVYGGRKLSKLPLLGGGEKDGR
jgi:hypothetical protein